MSPWHDVPKQEKNRLPGRLIILDGATGKSAGRYMEMPDGRELYSTPVLHTKKDGAQYVLFGHGGETISGRNWMKSIGHKSGFFKQSLLKLTTH